MQVFIASADRKLRLALLLLLESEPGMVVTGFTDRSEGLSAVIGSAQPNVLLLDYQVADIETTKLVRTLRCLSNPPTVIMLVPDSQASAELLTSGAAAVIGKNTPPDNLLPLLRAIRQSDKSRPPDTATTHKDG